MNNVELYAFGRRKTDGAWWIDSSKVVNRMYYVISGSAVVKCGLKDRLLSKGNIYILPQVGGFTPISSEGFEHIYFDYYSIPPLHSNSFIEISSDVCNLDSFFLFFKDALKYCTIDIAADFLRAILSIIDNNVGFEYISDSAVIKALELIHKNKDSITVKVLANGVNLNESYFIRLFSRVVGTTPMKYIRAYRLSEGKLMLKNGYSVQQTAEKCGYMTAASFSKAMRLEYGCCPKAFK